MVSSTQISSVGTYSLLSGYALVQFSPMPRARSHQPLTVRATPPGDEYIIKWCCQMFGLYSVNDKWIGRTCEMMTLEDRSTLWTTGDEVCGYVVVDVLFDYWRLLAVQNDA
jgi:hypothetical protein